MTTPYYHIGKIDDDSYVLLSSQPTFWLSGYFASYNERIITFSKFEIHEYIQSSREGFQKENQNIKFKSLSFEEYESLKILPSRLIDILGGIIELNENKSKNSSKTFYKIENKNIQLIKLLPASKCERIELKKVNEISVKINDVESYSKMDNNLTSISPELYDFLKYILVTSLNDRISLLNAIFFNK